MEGDNPFVPGTNPAPTPVVPAATVVPLAVPVQTYLEQRIHLEVARIDTEIKRIDRAVEVFRVTANNRHEQLRTELQTSFDQQLDTMAEKVNGLGGQVAKLLISLLVSLVGVLVAALVVVATTR